MMKIITICFILIAALSGIWIPMLLELRSLKQRRKFMDKKK